MSNQDYKNNPLFSDQYSQMQHGAASPSLQYRWDIQSGAWLPDTNEDKLDTILKVFSGQLSGIHVEAKLDHDTVAHTYLSSISGSTSGSLLSANKTNTLLEETINPQLNQQTALLAHNLSELQGVKSLAETSLPITANTLTESVKSNTWLSGISGELSDIEVHVSTDADTKTHGLLESVSGTLTGSLFEQKDSISRLITINNSLDDVIAVSEDIDNQSQKINDKITSSNTWLSGISGELSDIEVHVSTDADIKSHDLLESISGTLTGKLCKANDLLKEQKDLAATNLQTNQGTKDSIDFLLLPELRSSTTELKKSNNLLSGISGELSSIEVGVTIDSDTETHELISKSNTLLSGISGELADIEVGVTVDSDETAHGLLRSISGDALLARQDLDKIVPILSGKLITSDAKTHQALVNISGLSEVNNALSRLQFTKRTDTFTEKIEADHILMEAPDSDVYGNNPPPQYGVDRDILDDLFNTQYKNGRDNPNTPEAGQFFILDESAPDDRPKQRKYAFDTEAQYALKLDSFLGNQDGAQRLSDHGLDNIQNVTILNDSIYPIKIYSSETNYKSFYLYDGHSASIDNTNASDIMVKRDHLISDFNVDYTITYLDPNAEINLERVVGAFDPPEPPPETRWTTWAPQVPLAPEPPVATESPEVQGWLISETPIVREISAGYAGLLDNGATSYRVEGKVYGAKPATIVIVWGETEQGVDDYEEWDDFAVLGEKSNESFSKVILGLKKPDTAPTYYSKIRATNENGISVWSETFNL